MSAIVYILRDEQTGRHYIGSTTDLDRRLADHKRGNTPTTRRGGPWELIYSETLPTLSAARMREREIKSWKGGNKFQELLKKDRSR